VQISFQHELCDLGGEESSMVLQGFDSGDEIASSIRLQQESKGPSSEDLPHDLLGVVHGQNQHACLWRRSKDLPRRV
jgi:hypothetical protein